MTDQNSSVLLSILETAAHLQDLDISDNPSLGKSFHRIFSGELQLPRLEKLNLNNIGLTNAAELTQWLNRQSFPLLATASLRGNGIGAEEVEMIAKMFQNKLDIVTGMSFVVVNVGDEEGELE